MLFAELSIEARIQIVNTALVVITIIAAVIQVRLFRQQLRRDYRKARGERALTYFISHLPELRQTRWRLEEAFPWKGNLAEATPIPPEEIARVFESNKELQDDVVALLGHWESMALTVAAELTDEYMAFEMVAGSVVLWVSRFRDYIEAARRERNPRLYAYLIPLAERWQLRLKSELKEPLPYFYRYPPD